MDASQEAYVQQIVYGRGSLWVPWYAVGIAGRINAHVPAELFNAVLPKLGILHPPLASCVTVSGDESAWLTTEGVGAFCVDIRPKASDQDWRDVFLEYEQLPFEFGRGPLARFILLQGERSSDVVIVVPHVICDGYSMAHVMCDLVSLLNEPEQPVARPAPPPAVTPQSIPGSARYNRLLQLGVQLVNRVWPHGRRGLREQDYLELHRQYWSRSRAGALTFEIAPAEMSELATRCKRHRVSITSALIAAFAVAQIDFEVTNASRHRSIVVAVNIRDKVQPSPGASTGVYASSVETRLHDWRRLSVWQLAAACQSSLRRRLADRAHVLRPMVLNDLKPAAMDAVCAAVCTDQWRPETIFLSSFAKLKGTNHLLEVSNIGRIQRETAGLYPLDALLPWPPLVPGAAMALSVVTLDNRMGVVLRYRRQEIDHAVAVEIKHRAMDYLFCDR